MPGSVKKKAKALSKHFEPQGFYGWDFKKIAEDMGVVYLGHGSARVAFLTDGVVIKVAYAHKEHNEGEHKFYERFKDTEVGAYLAKIYEVAEDYSYLVMEYCGKTVYDEYEFDPLCDEKIAKVFRKVRSIMRLHGVKSADLHEFNVNADGVVFDYGEFCT